MTTRDDQTGSAFATTFVLTCPLGKDGRIAPDLLVTFEATSGRLADSTPGEIGRWVESWRDRHPGAVVVMGCNGKSRNSARDTRASRLKGLCNTLAACGVDADRVRYTEDVIDVHMAEGVVCSDRGAVFIMVLRSAVLDSAVLPICDLFQSIPPPGVPEYAGSA